MQRSTRKREGGCQENIKTRGKRRRKEALKTSRLGKSEVNTICFLSCTSLRGMK